MNTRQKNRFQFAIVGCGVSGLRFYETIRRHSRKLGISVNTIIEPDSNRIEFLKKKIKKNVRYLARIDEIDTLPENQRPSAAVIAVPKPIHVEMTLRALEHGLHSLVEKPLGFTAKDCHNIRAKARSTKKHVQVVLPDRWLLAELWNGWKVPESGPWLVNTMRTGPFMQRAADTNVLFDSLLADIDLYVLLDEIYGLSPIKKLKAWGVKTRSNFLDYANVHLELENGGNFHFFNSRLSTKSRCSWELAGKDWHASIDFMKGNMKRFQKTGEDLNSFEAHNIQAKRDPMLLELLSFLSSIKNGTFRGKYDLGNLQTLGVRSQSVIRTHEILDEIVSSIKVIEP